MFQKTGVYGPCMCGLLGTCGCEDHSHVDQAWGVTLLYRRFLFSIFCVVGACNAFFFVIKFISYRSKRIIIKKKNIELV